MNPDDLFRIITDFTTIYRVGAGLPPLKNPPEPEVLNGRDEDYSDLDEDEPDRYDWPDDHKTDDPRHGQADSLNREKYKP